MGTATQLHREIAPHAQYAHFIVVFFTEQRHGTTGLGGIQFHQLGFDCRVETNLIVDQCFHFRDLIGGHGFEMSEIETQPFGVHQRALLLHVIAQYFAQGRMQQMSGRVIQGSRLTLGHVYLGNHLITDLEYTLAQTAVMQMVTTFLGAVADIKLTTIPAQRTLITGLTTGLGVEGRVLQYHHAGFASRQLVDLLAVTVERDHLGAVLKTIIAGESGAAVQLDLVIVVHRELTGGTGTLTLGVHRLLKAVHIQRQLMLTGYISRQVHRETVGVIQTEHGLARDHLAIHLGDGLGQQLHAVLQGLGKLLFFLQQDTLYLVLHFCQFRIGFPHLLDQRRHQLVEEGLSSTQLVAVTDGATHDTAQYVTASLVGRQHPIGDQEGAGTDVVGNYAQ